MKKILSLVCLLLLISVFTNAQSKRNLTVDDFFKIKDLEDIQISPDGKWIAYVVKSFDLKKDKTNNVTVVKKMRDYSNEPAFKNKAEEAAKFLKKHGLPKSSKKDR